MAFDKLRVEQLYTLIERKRAVLAQQRLELAKLQAELDTFGQLYERLIGKLQDELDGVWQSIEQLQMADQRYSMNGGSSSGNESLWGPYGSLEEAFDAKYRNGPHADSAQYSYTKVTASDKELKLLYRKLARQYHPDTTTDPIEKQRRTVLMAQINAAYRAKNYKELRSLELDGGKRSKPAAVQVEPPPSTQQTLNDLTAMIHKLDDEIDWVKIEHQRLMTCPLMQFKIECSLARSQGRDVLREMASSLRADIADARRHLASIKRR
jgi:hypothetical protein